jgi:hypothetical protein
MGSSGAASGCSHKSWENRATPMAGLMHPTPRLMPDAEDKPRNCFSFQLNVRFAPKATECCAAARSRRVNRVILRRSKQHPIRRLRRHGEQRDLPFIKSRVADVV